MGPDTDELVCMTQDAFARLQDDNRMVSGDIVKQNVFILVAPLLMWHGLKWAFEITVNLIFVKRIINTGILVVLLFVIIMTQRKI